ncbi:MAG: CCA tRNA nucleotidyltransferase, partial [Gemmiger sp.]
TTYRLDGAYTDHRRPDAVRFVDDLHADLARRDFTINAMAYAPGEGLVDAFGGRADLALGLVRCVGDPAARFEEDALRILRAVRFCAQLGFVLEDQTAAAALAARDTVAAVSAERIYTEMDKLLAGLSAGAVLARSGEILTGVLPEIGPCLGCTQPGPWHCYDVWRHTAAAVGALDARGQDARGTRVLRWAAFLHDLAKPLCRSVGADGAAHFHGHNQRGARQARAILHRLRAPAYLTEGASALVSVHDMPLPTEDPAILRLLGRCGPVFLQRLCILKYADLDAHAPKPEVARRRAAVTVFERRMQQLAKTGCYTIAQLAVNGADVMEAGIRPGPAVGRILQELLQGVMDGALPNDRPALLEAIRRQANI